MKPNVTLLLTLVALTWLPACNSAASEPLVKNTPTAIARPTSTSSANPSIINTDIFTGIGTDLSIALPVGDAARGADLFVQRVPAASGSAVPCRGCHALQPQVIIVGPSLAGIASRAALRELGKSAAEYIRESIQAPNIYIVPDSPYFNNNGTSIMPTHLGSLLSPQDLADLIAFLFTLH